MNVSSGSRTAMRDTRSTSICTAQVTPRCGQVLAVLPSSTTLARLSPTAETMLHSVFTFTCQLLVVARIMLWLGAYVWGHMQSLCSYPLVSTTFRSCDTIVTNRTVWAAIPLLLGAQVTGLEQVINQTDDNLDIVMDLSETRISSLDLAILVQSSMLSNRDQISALIHKLADDALDLNRALQVFSAKVGAGFDRCVDNV